MGRHSLNRDEDIQWPTEDPDEEPRTVRNMPPVVKKALEDK